MSSLGIILERTRTEVKDTVNMIFSKSGIPAYLREGIILDILVDVREMKGRELAIEYLEEQNERMKKEESEGKNKEEPATKDNSEGTE